jgi:hypothetical protein
MELKINLESEINNINNFKYLLSKYKDFDACIRDIKISTLLGEKCLFEIEDINPPLICEFKDSGRYNDFTSLNQCAALIDKLSFKIDTDLTIFELKINYKIIDNKMGKLINEIQSLGIKLQILPLLSPGKNINGSLEQVSGFYIQKPETLYIKD